MGRLGLRIEALTDPVWTQSDAFWASPRMLGAALAPNAELFTSGHRLPDCPGVIGHTDINCPGMVEVRALKTFSDLQGLKSNRQQF